MNPADFVDEKRLQKDFENIKELTKDVNAGVTRLAYSQEENLAHSYIVKEAQKSGLKHRVDGIGNLYARLGEANKSAIRIGSHLDSVNNGGNYDGAVGVLTGLEALRCLIEAKPKLKHPVELVVLRAEEGARFNRGLIGSGAVTGNLTKEEAKNLKDENGVTLFEAIRQAGYEPDKIDDVRWDASEIKMFLEPHIEQNDVLYNEKIPIGLVTGIAAPVRFQITVLGQYDHSGATPMNRRKDAVAGAAEMILAAEKIALDAFNWGKTPVATVGNATVPYGSINKIAGKTVFYLDIRDSNMSDRDHVEKNLIDEFNKIAERRGLTVNIQETQRVRPAIVNAKVKDLLVSACKKLNITYKLMASGAAQDSQQIANYGVPTGMIFVPSRDGISHQPEEFTEMEDIATATKVLLTAIMQEQER